jgi:hypothetical protein
VEHWIASLHAGNDLGTPEGFQLRTGRTAAGPLTNGDEIASARFVTPLPSVWLPEEAAAKQYFPIRVELSELAPHGNVLRVLPFCLWGVDAVLAIFDPVFSHRAPPLLVTSSERPPVPPQ